LPNIFSKWLQLHQRSRSTRGAGAGAVFEGAGASANRPFEVIYLFLLSAFFEGRSYFPIF